MSTATCPEWCTDHSDGGSGHPNDEHHSAVFDGAIMHFGLTEYVINPEPFEVVYTLVSESDMATVSELRQLSAAAAEAADELERRQVVR